MGACHSRRSVSDAVDFLGALVLGGRDHEPKLLLERLNQGAMHRMLLPTSKVTRSAALAAIPPIGWFSALTAIAFAGTI